VWTQFFKCNEQNNCGDTGNGLCCHSNGRKASKKYLTIQQMIHYLTLEKRMIQSDSNLTMEIARLEDALVNLNEHQKTHLERLRSYNNKIQSWNSETADNSREEETRKHRLVIADYNSSPERKNRYLNRQVDTLWLKRYDSWQKDRTIIFNQSSLRTEILGQIDSKLKQQRRLLEVAIENNEGPEVSISLEDLNMFESGLQQDNIRLDNIREKVVRNQTVEITSGKCVSSDISGSCQGWWEGSNCLKNCDSNNSYQDVELAEGVREVPNICQAYRNLEDYKGVPDCRYDMMDTEGICRMGDTLFDVNDKKVGCQEACFGIEGYSHLGYHWCSDSKNGDRCYCEKYHDINNKQEIKIPDNSSLPEF